MTRSAALWLAAATLIAVLGFFMGRALHAQPQQASAFVLNAAAYEGARPVAGYSRGGFSGFGEVAGFDGLTFLGGRIVSLDSGSITVETAAGGRSTLRLAAAELSVIRPGARAELVPGANVVVRTAPDGEEAAAVLILLQP